MSWVHLANSVAVKSPVSYAKCIVSGYRLSLTPVTVLSVFRENSGINLIRFLMPVATLSVHALL